MQDTPFTRDRRTATHPGQGESGNLAGGEQLHRAIRAVVEHDQPVDVTVGTSKDHRREEDGQDAGRPTL
jgi:hypothetical protein